jgi:N-methylhydantoinase A
MSAEALRTLREEGIPENQAQLSYSVDLKYIGQFHEVTIPFASPSTDVERMKSDFAARHLKLYGYNLPGQAVEALHWRLTAVGRTERPLFARADAIQRTTARTSRDVVFDGRWISTTVYRGSEMSSGMSIAGPAIIEEPTTTIVISPGSALAVNEFGDYELTLSYGRNAASIAAAS